MSQFDDELEIDWGEAPVRVVPERLIMMRESLGLTSAKLARLVRTSRASVSNWESGSKQPTKFLPGLAKELDVFAPGFGMPVPPAVSAGPFFRSINIRTSEYVDQATAVARLFTDMATYFDRAIGLNLSSLPTFADLDPLSAARSIRAVSSVPDGPIPNTIRYARELGAVAMYSPRLKAAIDAYSVRAGAWCVIVLTPKGDFYRQRWDVAHELGHLVLRHELANSDRDIEAEAHQFAAELLAPEQDIKEILPESIDGDGLARLQNLKEEFGVSITALARRGHELGVMSDDEYAAAKNYFADHSYYSHEPGRMQTLEMAVAIPDAFERYRDLGFEREVMWQESGVPRTIFDAALSRVPLDLGRDSTFDH